MAGPFNLIELLGVFLLGVLIGDLAGWSRWRLRIERNAWEREAARLEAEIEAAEKLEDAT